VKSSGWILGQEHIWVAHKGIVSANGRVKRADETQSVEAGLCPRFAGNLQQQWNLRLRNGGGAGSILALERSMNALKENGLFLFAG